MVKSHRFYPLAAMLCTLLISCTYDLESGGKGNDIANYRTVQIGDQVWMAENLDYKVKGSVCYDNSEANCAIYGRLYDWSTAMALPSDCNSYTCTDQINTPHQGICPSGWHIPSDAEWETLMHFVGFFTATELKATSGWNDYKIHDVDEIKSGNGTDIYDFSALPGGSYSSDIYFGVLGDFGGWWGSSEDDRDAYCHVMLYNYDLALYSFVNKSGLFSVRCLQD